MKPIIDTSDCYFNTVFNYLSKFSNVEIAIPDEFSPILINRLAEELLLCGSAVILISRYEEITPLLRCIPLPDLETMLEEEHLVFLLCPYKFGFFYMHDRIKNIEQLKQGAVIFDKELDFILHPEDINDIEKIINRYKYRAPHMSAPDVTRLAEIIVRRTHVIEQLPQLIQSALDATKNDICNNFQQYIHLQGKDVLKWEKYAEKNDGVINAVKYGLVDRDNRPRDYSDLLSAVLGDNQYYVGFTTHMYQNIVYANFILSVAAELNLPDIQTYRYILKVLNRKLNRLKSVQSVKFHSWSEIRYNFKLPDLPFLLKHKRINMMDVIQLTKRPSARNFRKWLRANAAKQSDSSLTTSSPVTDQTRYFSVTSLVRDSGKS